MTQINTSRRGTRAALLVALIGAAPLGAHPAELSSEHVAESERARVTTLWRSERALDQYATEGLRIVDAVCAAVPAAEGNPSEGKAPEKRIHVGVAENCFELRWLEDPTLKKKDVRRRRRQRKAGETGEDVGPGAPEQPLMIAGMEALDPAGPVVAVAPKIHDRVMFGTGLPPTTRWTVALQTAFALGAVDPLGAAYAGLKDASFGADEALLDPFIGSGWMDLKERLLAAGDSQDLQSAALSGLSAACVPPARLVFDSTIATEASVELVARHVLASGMGPADVLAAEPQWSIEGGAIGRHPFGWHAVATRRVDALALSTVPRTSESFTLRTTFVALSNDLQVPAQADIVLGDKDGDRYLIICNTKEGVYVFRRPGPGEAYEAVAEKKELIIPPGRPVEILVTWKDGRLLITVGGTQLPVIILPEDAMAGSYGFGAHTGSTVMFTDLNFE